MMYECAMCSKSGGRSSSNDVYITKSRSIIGFERLKFDIILLQVGIVAILGG